MKKLLVLLRPIPLAIFSLIIVSGFLRYYLYVNSTQLVREFKNQNYKELYSLDVLQISSRLNSLSSVINWVCIEGSISDNLFYKMKKGSCSTGILQHKQELLISEANNLKIIFTMRLSKEVEQLFVVFFMLQVMLIFALIRSTINSEQEKRHNEVRISKLARKMSHDIRSPLATLNTILNGVEGITNEEKVLLNKAIAKINDISNSLLADTKGINSSIEIPKITKVSLEEVLQDTIKEKKIEYVAMKKLAIESEIFHKNIYSMIIEVEFKRILSNLINNSIEAIPTNTDSFLIKLDLDKNDQSAIIKISDNGKGISKSLLSKIGVEEFSTKKNGNGIGLIYSIETIKSWGGDVSIKSILNEGTAITILLPLVKDERFEAVLIDDDELVRLTWESLARKRNIRFISFSSYEDFEKIKKDISKRTIIYLDSELGSTMKGEEIALRLYNEGYHEIFITSGYDSERFKHLTFLKGVKNKAPPW